MNCGGCDNAVPAPPSGDGHSRLRQLHLQRLVQPRLPRVHRRLARDVPAGRVGLRGHDVRGLQGANSPSAAEKLGYHGPGRLTAASTRSAPGSATAAVARARGYQVGRGCVRAAGFVQGEVRHRVDDALARRYEADVRGSRTSASASNRKGDFVAKGAPRGYNEWFPVSVLVEASQLTRSSSRVFSSPPAPRRRPVVGLRLRGRRHSSSSASTRCVFVKTLHQGIGSW